MHHFLLEHFLFSGELKTKLLCGRTAEDLLDNLLFLDNERTHDPVAERRRANATSVCARNSALVLLQALVGKGPQTGNLEVGKLVDFSRRVRGVGRWGRERECGKGREYRLAFAVAQSFNKRTPCSVSADTAHAGPFAFFVRYWIEIFPPGVRNFRILLLRVA